MTKYAGHLVQLFVILTVINCNHDNKKAKVPDTTQFVSVSIFGETYLMENNAIWSPFGDACDFWSVGSYYDQKQNICQKSDLKLEEYTAADGIDMIRYTLSSSSPTGQVVLERPRRSSWIEMNGERLYCFSYAGETIKNGVVSNVIPLFLTRKPATSVSELNESEIVFIASISFVDECSIYTK